MPSAQSAVISLFGKDQGLSAVIGTNVKALENLTAASIRGSGQLALYAASATSVGDALGATTNAAKAAITSFGSVESAATSGYSALATGAERTVKAGDALGSTFNKLTLSALGFGSQTSTINSILQPTAGFFGAVTSEATGLGKAFTVLNEIEKPLVGGLLTASKVASGLASVLGNLGVGGQVAAGGMSALANSLGLFAGIVGKADAVGDLYQGLEKIKEILPEIVSDMQAVGGAVAAFGGAVVPIIAAQSAMGKLGIALTAASFVGTGWVKQLGVMYTQLFQIQQIITPVVAGFRTLADAISDAILHGRDFEKTLGNIENLGLDTSATRLTTSIGLIGEKLLFNTQASKEFASAAVAAFAKVEDAVSFITTLPSGLQAGIPALSKQLSELVDGPLQNTVTKGEAAAAMYQTLSAGIGAATGKLKESQPFMEAALKLASGTETNAATTVETLAKVTYAYNLNVKDAAKTAAALNGIVTEGIVTFPQLANGIGRVAGVAAQAKVPFNEMAGSIAALTKTMSADDAMTGYSSLLNSIAGAGEQSTKAAAELGVQFDLQAVKAKGLINVLKDLYDKSGGNIERIKEIIPESQAFGTALTLMTTAFSEAKQKADVIGKQTGDNLDELFGARQQSIIKQSTALMNGYQEVLAKFGEQFAPALQPGLDFLKEVLDRLKSLPEPIQATIGSIVAFNAGLEKAQGFVSIIVGTLAKLVGSFLAFRVALLFMTGGLGSVLQSLGGVVKIGATTEERLASLRGAFDKLTGATKIATVATEKFKEGQAALGKVNRILTTDVGDFGKNAIAQEKARLKQELLAERESKYAGAASDITTRLPVNAQGVAVNKLYEQADKRAQEGLNNPRYTGAASDIATRKPINPEAAAINNFYKTYDEAQKKEVAKLSEAKYAGAASDITTRKPVNPQAIAVNNFYKVYDEAQKKEAERLSSSKYAGAASDITTRKPINPQAVAVNKLYEQADKGLGTPKYADAAIDRSVDKSIAQMSRLEKAGLTTKFALNQIKEAAGAIVAPIGKAATKLEQAGLSAIRSAKEAELIAEKKAERGILKGNLSAPDTRAVQAASEAYVKGLSGTEKAVLGFRALSKALTENALAAKAAAIAEERYQAALARTGNQARLAAAKTKEEAEAIKQRLRDKSQAFADDYVNNMSRAEKASVTGGFAMNQVGARIGELKTRFPLIGGAINNFTTVLGFAKQGLMALWSAFGPLAVAMLALKAAFDAIGDVLPLNILGMESAASKAADAAGKYQELRLGIASVTDALAAQNKELDSSVEGITNQITALEKLSRTENEEAERKKNQEKQKALEKKQDLALQQNDKKYGFIAGATVGLFSFTDNLANTLSFDTRSSESKAASRARGKQDIRDIGDGIQTGVDDANGTTAIFNESLSDSDKLLSKTGGKTGVYNRGVFNTKQSRDILDSAKDRKLSSEEITAITKSETKALEANKKAIDDQVAGLQALLEAEKNPERQKAYKKQVADLSQVSNGYEQAQKAALAYLNATNSIADRILENTYDPENKLGEQLDENLKISDELTEKIKSAKDANEKALLENQKTAVDGNIGMLDEIQKGMDATGGLQKKELNSLLTAYKEFSENTRRVRQGKDFSDLNTMQAKADKILAEVDANADNLAVSARKKLIDEVLKQNIRIPNKNIEGNILGVGQIKAALALRAKIVEEEAQKEVDKNNRKVGKIAQQEALGLKRSVVAQKETIDLQIKNDNALLSAKQENLGHLDYGKETEIYKKAQDEILEIQRGIEQKKVKAFSLGLDNRQNLLERGLNRESALIDLQIDTGLKKERDGQQELFNLRQKQNLEQRKILSDRIADLKKRGGDFAELEIELLKLRSEFESNQVDNDKRLLDQKYLDKQLSFNKEQALLESSLVNAKTTERKFADESFTLRQKDNQDRQAKLVEQIADLKKRNKDARTEELELLKLQDEFKSNKVDNNKRLLEQRYEDKQLNLGKERSLLEASYLDNKTTEEKFTTESFELRKKDNQDRQSKLIEQIADLKKRNKDARATENELAQAQIEARKIPIEEEAKNTERRKAQIANSNTALTQSLSQQVRLIEVQSDRLQKLNDIQKSRNDVLGSEFDLTQGRLDNQLKLTGDIIKSAAIESQMAKNRFDNLTRTQAVEKQQLIVQASLQQLALKKEAINNRIAIAENQRARATLALDIAQSKRENKSKEELNALLLQRDALTDQKDILNAQSQDLESQKSSSKEMADNAVKELDARQRLAQEGGAIDLELAKRKEILAVYDKQREDAQLYAQQVDLINTKETNKAEALTKAYERQTSILEAQKAALDSKTNRATSELQIALDLTKSEFKKRDLAEAIAQIKYRSLVSQQALEKKVLELQILQNKAALERERIQIRAQQAQNKADVLGAYADLQKVEATPTSTETQKQAARLNVEAKIEQGAALAFGADQVEKKAQNQNFFDQQQRSNLEDSQAITKNQALLAVIESLPKKQKAIAEASYKNSLLQKNLGFTPGQDKQNYDNLRNSNYSGANAIFDSYSNKDRNNLQPAVQGVTGPKVQSDDYEKTRLNFLAAMKEFMVPLTSLPQKPNFQVPKIETPGATAANPNPKPPTGKEEKKSEPKSQFGEVKLTIDSINVTVEAHKDAANVAAKEVGDAILDQLHGLATRLKTKI